MTLFAAEMSDNVQMFTAACGLVGTIFTGWVGYLVFKLGLVAKASHTLLNSGMGIALKDKANARRDSANLAKQLAELLPTEANKVAAAIAERHAQEAEWASADHQQKQAVVDAQVGTARAKSGN
jgi:hypothetical protein